MGLDLWFREDVARILASTHETLRASAGAVAPLDEERAAAYQQGFEDALRAVGVAFGVGEGIRYRGQGTRDWELGPRNGRTPTIRHLGRGVIDGE
jgi:hypothetical protein